MFDTPAIVLAAATPAAGGLLDPGIMQIGMLVVLFALFYLMIIRPQQRRAKEHQERVSAI
jgi:preprotein translocase subunit YajC